MKSGLKSLERALEAAQEWLQQNWQRALRIREKLRFSEEAFHLVMAGCVGVIGGFTNLIFYLFIEAVQDFALHRVGDPVEIASILEWWQRILYCGFGGLAAGLVLHWGLQFVKQPGTANMLEAVAAGDGRLRFRPAILKGVSSLLSIGTGASIGREGAIAQLTATLASKVGQLANWQPYRLRLLVACGAASGISAAYNAPVAGAVFAAQIVLGNFSMNLFAPLVFASVVATMVSRTFFGIEPWYKVPPMDFTQLVQLPWFLLLGLLCGVLGAFFLKMLRQSETWFSQIKAPIYVRLALGGVIVGVFAAHFPEVWGNGYGATNRILGGGMGLEFLIGLFLAKLLATLASVGSGTVGGVFTPTLFLGAAMGSIFGTILHAIGLAHGLPTGVFALVGMAGVLAGTVHSPLLAMIVVFEISLNYSLMPPLMLACAISSLVAKRLHPDSIYTAPLRAKGLEAGEETAELGVATQQTVGEIMREAVPPLHENSTIPQIAQRFLRSTYNFLPVVDKEQRLRGVVALQDLKEYLNAGQELNAVIAYDVMRPVPPCLTPSQRLLEALPVLLASEQRNVPVVNSLVDLKLVGAVAKAEALGRLAEVIAANGQVRK
ncbi:MAG: ClcB-like voltage-gated chloride channel protein [Verrucomicrobiota bacterium]